jgi:hypothetical protein
MSHTSKFSFLGRLYQLPTRYVRKAKGVGILVSLLASAYLAYLVLTVVDYHLGTTRVGAAIILSALLVELTFKAPGGDECVALLPKWGRDALTAVLLAVTLVTFLMQGEVFHFAFVTVAAGWPIVQGLAARNRTAANAREQARKELAQGLTDLGYGKHGRAPDDDRRG